MNSIEIKYGYSLLHFDEYPILFMGFNNNHEVVIGSFLYENDDDTVSYLYSVIPNSLASRFVHKNISYLELLKETETIFIVEKNYNDFITNVQQTNISEIDPDILPLPTAYCPVVDRSVKNRFGNRLIDLKRAKLIRKENTQSKDTFGFLFSTGHHKFPDKARATIIHYKGGGTSIFAYERRNKQIHENQRKVKAKSITKLKPYHV